ncbi:hypothetical protein D9_0174 [Aeromonas phage D9]|uniref:Uncharacterized protein n=1 Tax=Aeromonas phage D6 TaxID=2593322 RepID=A0A514TW36_9CAUD|nr:hypothetical protein PQC08_gp199 [Aeromonas phage D6]QDJ97236.1 hypothetical protein D6_0076 [Aeromonas phage D6]QEP52381.1 hypothetical protein D9_0174 [Aeromonas phage D9]
MSLSGLVKFNSNRTNSGEKQQAPNQGNGFVVTATKRMPDYLNK